MTDFATPVTHNEDMICVWTFKAPPSKIVKFTLTTLDVTSKYGAILVFDGNVNNTRPFEYPNVIEWTSYLRS